MAMNKLLSPKTSLETDHVQVSRHTANKPTAIRLLPTQFVILSKIYRRKTVVIINYLWLEKWYTGHNNNYKNNNDNIALDTAILKPTFNVNWKPLILSNGKIWHWSTGQPIYLRQILQDYTKQFALFDCHEKTWIQTVLTKLSWQLMVWDNQLYLSVVMLRNNTN